MNSTRQQGFSLVELMIALVLGLMIGGAVLQAFIYNNRSIDLQREAVALQEQGRAALEFITRYTRMAGFQEDDLTNPALSTGVSGADDSLTIEFQAGSASTASFSLYNCLGQTVSPSWVSVNTFTASGANFVCNTQFRTTATGQAADASDATFNSGTLIENIKEFKVLYGLDSDSDNAANRYVEAGSVGGDWDDVVALKICLVLETDRDILDQNSVFSDCDSQPYPATERLIRQVRTTIALRNRTGG